MPSNMKLGKNDRIVHSLRKNFNSNHSANLKKFIKTAIRAGVSRV